MLFQSKTQACFVDRTEFYTLIARASGFEAPLKVDQIRLVPAGNDEAIPGLMREMFGKTPSGYVPSHVAVYPSSRLVRRITLDPKRFKDPAYLPEVVSTQFKVEASDYTLNIIHPKNGADFELEGSADKEAVFCGGPARDFASIQDELLELGIYPEQLQLGSVATCGALIDYARSQEISGPTLFLEIGMDGSNCYILGAGGVDVTRPVPHGINAMIPLVQKELSLKDEESARKLFFSDNFDFTGMGPTLTRRLIKDLQSSIGFYEVQTGQSVGQVVCTQLPPKLGWLAQSIAGSLGVDTMGVEFKPWLESRGITLAEGAWSEDLDLRLLGLFSLMGEYNAVARQKAG